MAQNRKTLKKLLEFIENEIINMEGNEWFHDELALIFVKRLKKEKDHGIKIAAMTIMDMGNIDKYLEERVVPIIDYSKITDKSVRFQLERDSIEMGKIRLSNFDKPISYAEYCKYAHYQAEGLINYYLCILYKNRFQDLLKEIKESFADFKINKSTVSVSSIPYTTKRIFLQKKANMPFWVDEILKIISEIRNNQSHRSSMETELLNKHEQFIDKGDFYIVLNSLIALRDLVISALRDSDY
jgi:hypothetical protein